MKKFTWIITLIVVVSTSSFAQNDDNGNFIYPNYFQLSLPLNDGKIPFPSTGGPNDINITGSVGMFCNPLYENHLTYIETRFVVRYDDLVLYTRAGPTFHLDDFMLNNHFETQSKLKNFSIPIPVEGLRSYTPTSDYKLELQYRFNYDHSSGLIPGVSQSGWLPYVFDGRSHFVSNKKYSFVMVYPSASIAGPSSISCEGTYIINNATSVTLENNNGLASLTKINNNTYKITRIYNLGVGTVQIKAINLGGEAKIMNVNIGIANVQLEGPLSLSTHYHANNEQEFELIPNPGESFTITRIIADRATTELERTGPYKFKMKIPGNWGFPPLSPHQDFLKITVIDETGECSKGISKIITIHPNPNPGDSGGGWETPGN